MLTQPMAEEQLPYKDWCFLVELSSCQEAHHYHQHTFVARWDLFLSRGKWTEMQCGYRLHSSLPDTIGIKVIFRDFEVRIEKQDSQENQNYSVFVVVVKKYIRSVV